QRSTTRCTAVVWLAEDVLLQLLVLFREENVVLQDREEVRTVAEALYLGLQISLLFVLPVEDKPAVEAPSYAVGKADRLRGGKNHLRHEQLRRFRVVAADLIDAQGNGSSLVAFLHSITSTGMPLMRKTTSSRVPCLPLWQ